MRGYAINFIPGWDCHGLPIEVKALSSQQIGTMSAPDIRAAAKRFALSAMKQQRTDFIRWGIMGDWQNSYLTLQPTFEDNQLGVFWNMYQRNLIYRGLRPVLWSPSSQTALAEAEVEYDEQHISPSLYALFEVKTHTHTQQRQQEQQDGDIHTQS